VPYTGAALAMNATLATDVTMFCGPIAQGLVHVKAGKLYALGVTGVAASPLLPEVAPLSATYPGLVISNWHELFAPNGTPVAVTQFLNDEFKMVFSDAELQQKMVTLGIDPVWLSGPELSRTIAKDIASWTEFIKAANITSD
jgi:tripartite-type tricarboxylate transporter receptor subunit TctC